MERSKLRRADGKSGVWVTAFWVWRMSVGVAVHDMYNIYNTVAEMQSDLKLTAIGTKVSTAGYYSAGDGGGATYMIDDAISSDSYTEYLANGYYANMCVSGTVNVLQFGAIPNDPSKQDDNNRAFANAIKYAPLHGSVLIPAKGTYYVSTVIKINRPILFAGDYTGCDPDASVTDTANDVNITTGEYGSPLIYTQASDFGIHIAVPGVVMENISIKAAVASCYIVKILYDIKPVPKDSTDPLSYQNRNLIIRNVVIQGIVDNKGVVSPAGIYAPGGLMTSVFERVVVYSCDFGFMVETSLPSKDVVNSTSLVFNQCCAKECTITGYYLNNADYSSFISCVAEADEAEMTYGYTIVRARNISFIACRVRNATTHGIYCSRARQVTINATMENCYNGIRLENDSETKGSAVVKCCRFENITHYALSLLNASALVMMSNISSVDVNESSRTIDGTFANVT